MMSFGRAHVLRQKAGRHLPINVTDGHIWCLQARLERERKLKEIAEAAAQGKLPPAPSSEAAEAAERAKKRCRAPSGVPLSSSAWARMRH